MIDKGVADVIETASSGVSALGHGSDSENLREIQKQVSSTRHISRLQTW